MGLYILIKFNKVMLLKMMKVMCLGFMLVVELGIENKFLLLEKSVYRFNGSVFRKVCFFIFLDGWFLF